MKAWGDTTTECGEGPVSHVDTDKMGLPKLDNAGAVLEKNEGPGVFRMHVHTSSGGKVRLVIEAPIISADATAKGLLKGKVGLDPSDCMQLMSMGEDGSPEITVLPRGQCLSMQNGV